MRGYVLRHVCGGCDSSWAASSYAHCGNCHLTFGAVGSFDKHRAHYGEHGACRTPEECGLEIRDGICRGPELSPEKREKFQASRG